MASIVGTQLVSATTRDGVDTRPKGEKENSGKTAVGTGETTRVGASHDRDEQTAATYLPPPGAEVPRSNMSAFWTNYLRTAEHQVNGDPLGHFIFTTFNDQQCRNEEEIERECRKLGAGEEMLNIYRMRYNRMVTEYLRDPNALNLTYVRKYLADYNGELRAQQKAALRIQRVFKTRLGKAIDADSSEVTPAVMDLVNRAVNMAGTPEWEAFWAAFQDRPQLRIRKPKPKNPCARGCGAESTCRVRGKNMCEPCADFAQNKGWCADCGLWVSLMEKNVVCYECHDAYLQHLDEQEDRYYGYW
jgi:hypothetical protein